MIEETACKQKYGSDAPLI